MLFSPGVLVKGSASSYDIIYCLAITDLEYSKLKTGLPWPRAKGFQGWHMEVAGQASLFLFPLCSMQELALCPPIGSVSAGRANTGKEAKETHAQIVLSLASACRCLM